MVDLKTAIDELNHGKIEFIYNEDCCTTEGEVVIFLKRLEELEKAEEKKEKHGEWRINPDGYYPYCYECKEEPESGKMTKCCPNCGAIMDGKEG